MLYYGEDLTIQDTLDGILAYARHENDKVLIFYKQGDKETIKKLTGREDVAKSTDEDFLAQIDKKNHILVEYQDKKQVYDFLPLWKNFCKMKGYKFKGYIM